MALIAASLIGVVTGAQAAHNCAIASHLTTTLQATTEANQAKDVHCLLCASSHLPILPSVRMLIQPSVADQSKPLAAFVSWHAAASCFSLYIRPPPAN
jgi:hypothetical protein